MGIELKSIIDDLIKEDHYQEIINSEDFYFEKLKVLFNEYKSFSIGHIKRNMEEFINNPPEIFHFQEFLDSNKETSFIEFLELIGRMITIFDGKGYNINKWNPYQDKRHISPAIFTQKNWTFCFFKYTLNNFSFDGWDEKTFITFQHAIRFIENPGQNVNITSQNHRGQICNYFELKNESEIITLFPDYASSVKNSSNQGVLIASILYHPNIIKLWQDSVIGLMASDSTGWQDDFIEESTGHDACIIWNSKRPSGTKETIKSLRQIILEGRSFNLYYCSAGYVHYVAVVIDFAENQKELDIKNWSGKDRNIYDFHKNFADYVQGEKSAKIVFLASNISKIDDIPVSDFEFYKDYSPPRQDNLSPLKAEAETFLKPFVPLTKNQMKKNNPQLNLILFGPPGTGKTYNTVNKALEIIGESIEGKPRKEIKEMFDSKMQEGQIVFTTFHQSMSYEDFIEGIKPIEPEKESDPVIYRIQYGVFRNLCIEASFAIAQLRETKTTEEVLDFSILYDKFVESIDEKLLGGEQVELETKAGGSVMVESISHQGNFIIKHHEGTRTYTVSKARLTKLQSAIKDLSEVSNINDKFREIIGGSNSSAYWSVLNAIRKEKHTKIITKENRTYTFDEKKEVVLSLSKADYKNKNGKPFVLIIDEINRGNVSQIFGELITLIEEDKRLGNDEALEATLPYSKEKFGVPPNLYIIGTMNTADRSVEAIDTALRRRFCFEEMSPLYVLDEVNYEIAGHNVSKILFTINKRIEKLLDKDHAIGHSYFIRKIYETPEEKFLNSFYHNIIPLLQEYFFGDFGKIGLVLGQGFVRMKEWNKNSDSFADFDYESASEFEDRSVYEIIDYRKETDGLAEFLKAIRRLMNEKVE